jgi:tRNA uridine 5-carboxymethylaminomethyl modification enzyme
MFHVKTVEQAEIQLKYQAYIDKERELVEKANMLEHLVIPDNFDYTKLSALSMEARQKFTKIKPHTLGQASRISGVNPTDIQILMVFYGKIKKIFHFIVLLKRDVQIVIELFCTH